MLYMEMHHIYILLFKQILSFICFLLSNFFLIVRFVNYLELSNPNINRKILFVNFYSRFLYLSLLIIMIPLDHFLLE